MQISARNTLKGKIVDTKPGVVNFEVTLELPCGQKITSVITKASAEGLGLKVGMEAYAVIKSSSVMIAVD
jgi:molybdopterin-binding protein